MAPSSPDDIPTRNVHTEWGAMFVTSTQPDVLHFSTNRTGGGGESQLTINGIAYSCTVDLRCSDRGIKPRDYTVVDEVWRVSVRQRWGGLRRLPQWGEATEGARRVLQDDIIPALVRTAHTEELGALLDDGEEHWRADLSDTADAAERTLVVAAQQIAAIRLELDAGRRVSADDETFLRRLRVVHD